MLPWKKARILIEQNEVLTKERDMFKARCKDLEDAVEKEYGVKVRNEITEVKADFTKDELVIMYAAICKAMAANLSTEDIKYYLDLRVKLEKIINLMKD